MNAQMGVWLAICAEPSDLALKILVHIFGVAIRAFDKPVLCGDLQIDPRMTQRAFAAVTGHAKSINNLGFGGFDGHEIIPFPLPMHYLRYEPDRAQGQDPA